MYLLQYFLRICKITTPRRILEIKNVCILKFVLWAKIGAKIQNLPIFWFCCKGDLILKFFNENFYFQYLTIPTWKNLYSLNSVQKFTEIQGWPLATFFICLHNQLSSSNSIIAPMFEKHDSSNRQETWMAASFSTFYGKLELVFILTFENAFS